MKQADVYDAHVHIRALPREVDKILEQIATRRGMHKWELVRAALCEFAENHKDEVAILERSAQ